MSVRMIATDLDGTLLDEEKRIPPESVSALRICAEKGIRVTFASGRSFQSARMLAKPLSHPVALVSLNGARADETVYGPMLYEQTVSPEAALSAWQALKATGGYFIAYAGPRVYMGNPQPCPGHDHRPGMRGDAEYPQEYTLDEADFLREGFRRVNKLVIFSRKPEILQAAREVAAGMEVEVSSSWRDNVELLPRGVSKGGGLLRLAARFGVAAEDIMAFGDGDNDESMLSAVGHPVAMEQGEAVLKRAGRPVARSVGGYLMERLEAGDI